MEVFQVDPPEQKARVANHPYFEDEQISRSFGLSLSTETHMGLIHCEEVNFSFEQRVILWRALIKMGLYFRFLPALTYSSVTQQF